MTGADIVHSFFVKPLRQMNIRPAWFRESTKVSHGLYHSRM